MSTTPDVPWIRLSRTCQNKCVFCSDADALDGRPVELDAIKAELDAAVASGARAVVLSGGEPTQNRNLLAAIRHAKSLGLYVSLTTNGRVVQSEKVANVLASTGLDEIHVSVHAGRRSTHDALADAPGAWVEGLAGLRFLTRTSIAVWMNCVFTTANEAELEHLMHLATMAGVKGFQLRNLTPDGRLAKDPALFASLAMKDATAVRMVSTLWYFAKDEVIAFDALGWDDSRDDGHVGDRGPAAADASAMRLLRKRVWIDHAQRGFTLLDVDGVAKDVNGLLEACGPLPQVAAELAAHGAPYVDAPPCLSGQPTKPDQHAPDAVYGASCDGCGARAACPGLPRKLGKAWAGSLAPRPWWSGGPDGAWAVLPGGGLLGRALGEVALALVAHGRHVDVSLEAVTAETRRLVVGDASLLAAAVARAPDADVVLFDRSLGVGVSLGRDWRGADHVRALAPGRVDALRTAGIPLERVLWRPSPVPDVVRLTPYATTGPVVVIGEVADHARVERGLLGSRGALPRVEVVVPHSVEVPTSGGWEVRRVASDDETLAAILAARLVVYAPRKLPLDPASTAAQARDLAWVALAQACGRPVVALRGPGVEDLVRHDVTGLLLTRGEAKSALGTILVNACVPNKLLRWSDGARRRGVLASPAEVARELVEGVPWAAAVGDAVRRFPTW